MKNIILSLIAAAIIVAALFVCGDSTRYTREAVVVDYGQAGTVYAEDATGNVWGFAVSMQIPRGSTVTLHMDTNGTEHYICDDIVVDFEVVR